MGTTPGLKLPIPELTETADGPDAFSDLANATEDFVYDRILPAGVTRVPSYFWGQGVTYPTGTELRPGDVYLHTSFGLRQYNGTTWVPADTADRTLGDAYLAAPISAGIAGAPSWTDLAVVTATSRGGLCVARWSAVLWNGGSGLDRTANLRVICDSSVLGSFTDILIPEMAPAARVPKTAAFDSTPTAGAHTWRLQANASWASAVIAETALLTVVERT